jgi:hypothetical protein
VDVFPIEFLNFKLVHHALYGEDLLGGLEIDQNYLRLQCEREIKGKIVWLHKIYLSALGDKKVLAADIVGYLRGYLPILRGILHLLGQAPPVGLMETADLLFKLTGVDADVFKEIYSIKKNRIKPSGAEVSQLFARFYGATAKLVEVVDGIKI